MTFGDMLRRSREVPDLRSPDPSEAEWVPPPARDDQKMGSTAIYIAAHYHEIISGRLDPEGVSPEALAKARERQAASSDKLKRANSNPDILYMRLD